MFHDEPNKRQKSRSPQIIASVAHALAHERVALVRARSALASVRTGDEARQMIAALIGDIELKVDACAGGVAGNA